MIKVYKTRGKDRVTQKVVEWLDDHHLVYEFIRRKDLTRENLKHILSLTDIGFEEIMVSSKRAYGIYERLTFDFEESTTEELISFLLGQKSLLKNPIIFDETHLCVGFNHEILSTFIPSIKNPKGCLRIQHRIYGK